MNTESLPRPSSDLQETLFHLIRKGSVTSVELRQLTKSSYPAARCYDLKRFGVSILSKPEKYVNRRGKVSSISRYFLLTKIKEATKIYKQLVKG